MLLAQPRPGVPVLRALCEEPISPRIVRSARLRRGGLSSLSPKRYVPANVRPTRHSKPRLQFALALCPMDTALLLRRHIGQPRANCRILRALLLLFEKGPAASPQKLTF